MEELKKYWNAFKKNADDFLLIFILLFCLVFVAIAFLKNTSLSNNLGDIGSFLGGTTSSIIGGLTLYLVYQTYKAQDKEMKATREQLKQQNFETTFFNLLKSFNECGDKIRISIKGEKDAFEAALDMMRNIYQFRIPNGSYQYEVNEYLGYAYLELKNKIDTVDPKQLNMSNSDLYSLIENNNTKELRRIYSTYRKTSKSDELLIDICYGYIINYFLADGLGQYYRIFNSIIEHIQEVYNSNNEFDELQKKKYSRFLQTRLSNSELNILLYNCLSKYSTSKTSGNKDLSRFVAKYEMLKNIDNHMLISPNHYIEFEKKYSDPEDSINKLIKEMSI